MNFVIDILRAIFYATALTGLIGFVLAFLCWPVNDDQNQAPAWVACRFIKSLFK